MFQDHPHELQRDLGVSLRVASLLWAACQHFGISAFRSRIAAARPRGAGGLSNALSP
jgi:hypothetical protein